MTDWLDIITLGAALGSGLMAGIFFTFSNTIMKALGQRPAHEAMAAMQTINVVIVNPLFLLVFLGTAITSFVVVVAALLNWQNSSAIYLLSGGVLYLVGSIGVSAAVNIPKNNTLAAANPQQTTSANLWANYLATWTAWNHVRTLATLAAAILLTIALTY